MTTTKTINANEHTTLTIAEGEALTIMPAAISAGMAYLLDGAAGGGNSSKSWTLAAGVAVTIGPYVGSQRVRVTCSAGSVATSIFPASLLPQGTVTPVVSNLNVATSGIGAINSASYQRWRAAKARVRAGSGFAKQACVGDSTEAGAYSLGSAVGVNGNRNVSHSVLMAYCLGSKDMPAISDNFVGDQGFKITNSVELGNYDPRITFTTGFLANASTKTAGGSIISNSANSTGVLTFAPLLPVDTFDIYYATNSGLGSFAISRTGDASSPTISQNSAAGVGKYTFTGALGANPLNITPVAQGVYIIGIDAYNSKVPSLRVLNVGWSGGKTADWIDTSTGFASLNALKALACDLYLIRPGINEWNTSVPVATFQANLDTLVAALMAVGDVALATPYPSQASAFSLVLQKTYVDAILAVAAKYGLAVNDTWGKVGSWELGNSLGYYANTLHPVRALYEKTAEADANFLLAL